MYTAVYVYGAGNRRRQLMFRAWADGEGEQERADHLSGSLRSGFKYIADIKALTDLLCSSGTSCADEVRRSRAEKKLLLPVIC